MLAQTTFTPLRNPTFRMLWIAALATNLGNMVQAVGAAWMMTTLGGSPTMVALVQSSVTLPIMVFSLVAGVLADNFDRRRVMLCAQIFMFIVSVALTVTAFAGLLTPWSLLAFTFVIGCGMALNIPSYQASVGDIVPREELPAAVTLNGMGFNMMRSVGPAFGGVLVAAAGAAAAFALNALSYLAIITALWRWSGPSDKRVMARERFGGAVSSGLRYVAMSPNLMRIIMRGCVFGLSASAVMALMPLVARDLLSGGAQTFGLMLGAFGIGAVAAAFANAGLRARFSNEQVAQIGFVGMAVCAAGLALGGSLLVSGLFLMLGGCSWVFTMSLFNATLQLLTPRWVVGRVVSLYQTATFGGMAFGSWSWGAISSVAGLSDALLYSAALLVLGAAMGRLVPMPDFGRANLQPLENYTAPPLQMDVTDRSGPVMVIVSYVIDEADVPKFLAAMTERRRIRRRDGAQHWVILRDLETPDRWSESYHVPTWADYLRHMQRRTKSDAEVWARLRDLHRGPNPPEVHRMIERHSVPGAGDMLRRATGLFHMDV